MRTLQYLSSFCLLIIIVAAMMSPDAAALNRRMTGSGSYIQEEFGRSVSCSADINGDGIYDLVVGSPNNDHTGNNAGAIYIYWGGPFLSFNDIPDVVIYGENPGDNFGFSISARGDLNDDVYDDLLVGSPGFDDVGTNRGKVDIFFGGGPFDTTADWSVVGTADNAEFGARLAFLDNVGGASGNDLAISYLTYSPLRTWNVAVFYGGTELDTTVDGTISETVKSGSKYFENISISSAGDFNDDGYFDLIVGSGDDNTALLYYGGLTFDTTADLVFNGVNSDDGFGFAVCGEPGCDLNNDGIDDIVISAPYVDINSLIDAGRVFVYYGGPIPDTVADVTIDSSGQQSKFGESLAVGKMLRSYMSDTNYNIAIGSSLYGSPTEFGAVFVYRVSPTYPGYEFQAGEQTGARFGFSVDIGGDCFGDGTNDLFVGAPYFGSHNEGKVYLFDGQEGDYVVPELHPAGIIIVVFVLGLAIIHQRRRGMVRRAGLPTR